MKFNLNSETINSYLNDSAVAGFITKNLNLLSGDVLDIGCGRMRHKKSILSGVNVRRYIGLDLEAGKFSYSVKADAYWDGIRMPFSDNSLDSALLLEVIEHCPDPLIVLQETQRVLKPNGIIFFSTPFLYQLHGTPYDYHRPTPFELELLFRSAGFDRIQSVASGHWDASLGQMIGIWICHRPMPILFRKILKRIFVPFFKLLLIMDKKHNSEWRDDIIMPGILGIAYKT